MASPRRLDLVWIALISLTLGGATLGEAVEPGFWVTVIIAAIMAFKGRMVIDQFMELGGAHRSIRRTVRFYGLLFPLLVILSYLFGPQIARLTGL